MAVVALLFTPAAAGASSKLEEVHVDVNVSVMVVRYKVMALEQ